MFKRRPDYKLLSDNWKNIASGWEQLCHQKDAEAQKATALLMAAAIIHPAEQSKLEDYAKLITDLVIAAKRIYSFPKVGPSCSEEDIRKLMDAVQAFEDKVNKDKIANLHEI